MWCGYDAGIVSSAADVLWMSWWSMCLARGGVDGEG